MERRPSMPRALVLTAATALSLASVARASAPAEFLYAANASDDTVSAFRVDAETGTLLAVPGSPFATGPAAVAAVVERTNRFLYVVSNLGGVYGYRIGTDGGLTAIAGSPFASLTNPGTTDLTSAAVDPSGRFLYVTDALYEKVRGMRIDAASGALSILPGSPFALGNNARAVTVDPSGRFLYASASNDGVNDGISAYAIDPASGALARLAGTPVTAGGGSWPYGGAVDPSGRYVYVANATSGDLSAYAIDLSTGVPSPVTATPYASGAFASAVAVTPSRRFVYAANQGANTITAYALDGATGALSPAAGGASFAGGSGPGALLVDATGDFVYVANAYGSTVSGYRIGATGGLSPVPSSPFAVGGGPAAIATTRHDDVFADDFESGDLAAWTAASTDGGDLAVADQAGLQGARLLSAQVNDTRALFVRDDHPQGEGRYRVRFLLDPSGFDPGTADGHNRMRVLIASEDGLATRRVVTLVLRKRGGEYAIGGRVRLDDDSRADTPFVPLTPGSHAIQLDWRRSDAPPAQSGSFELFVDDVSVATLVALDNDGHAIDSVRLGAMGLKAGAAGPLLFDAFASRRYGYIWP